MSYRRISEQYVSFTATSRSRVIEEFDVDPEEDPTPSFPPMRVVPTDGVTVAEATFPLAKCAGERAVKLKRVG
jgi:hypothetical protein